MDTYENIADSNQTPKNAVYGQGLQFLLTGRSKQFE